MIDDTGESGQTQTSYGMGEAHGLYLYTVYDTATGRIIKYGKARDINEDGGASMAMQCDVGQSALAVSAWPDPKTMYVPEGVLTQRPLCPVSVGVVGRVVTLSGVPSGAAWSIGGTASLAGVADASGMTRFTFSAAGNYTLSVNCFPAQDFTQEIILP